MRIWKFGNLEIWKFESNLKSLTIAFAKAALYNLWVSTGLAWIV
jgi:hypothetical protein